MNHAAAGSRRPRAVRKLELAAGGNHLILGAYTNMQVAIVVTGVGDGELQQHRQQAAKSEWQLARLDLWPIAIGLGCQHDTVTNIGADYCSCYCCFAPLPPTPPFFHRGVLRVPLRYLHPLAVSWCYSCGRWPRLRLGSIGNALFRFA